MQHTRRTNIGNEDCYLDFSGFTRIDFSRKAFRGRGKIGTFLATIFQRLTAVEKKNVSHKRVSVENSVIIIHGYNH